jgi:hypothetical protein
MIKATHIATKLILLIAITLLFALTRYASAQENTSAAPYFGSTHRYGLPIGNSVNDVTWQLTNPNTATVVNPVGVVNTTADPDSATVDITFDNATYGSVAGTWTLTYREMSNSNGNCVAVRTMDITPMPNLFNLSMDLAASACNSYSGTIFDNTVNDISAITGNSSVPFNVKMNKALNFRLKEWSFTGSVTVSGCNTTAVLPSVVVTPSGAPVHGSLSFTGTGSNFTGRVTGINPADDFSTDDITFNIVVNGSPTADYVITLDIVGTALSGTNYTVSTGENSAADNKQVNTIYGIPNTSVVSVTP